MWSGSCSVCRLTARNLKFECWKISWLEWYRAQGSWSATVDVVRLPMATCSLLTFPWWCSSSSRPALRERLYALNLDFMVWTINIFIWIWELFLEMFFSILEVFFLQIGSFFFSIWYLGSMFNRHKWFWWNSQR